MKRPELPTVDLTTKISVARAGIVVACAMIATDTWEAGCELSHRMNDRDEENDNAVRGNRSDQTPITWDDLRLMTISTLKICLATLEQDPC